MKRTIKGFGPEILRERKIEETAESTGGGRVGTLQERIKGMRERLEEREIERERIQGNQNPGGEGGGGYEGCEEGGKDD